MNNYRLFFLIFILTITTCIGQTPDVLRIEHTYNPENNSGISVNRYRALMNAPIKLSDKSNYLIVGGEYNTYVLTVNQTFPFESKSFKQLHVVDLNLGYTFKMNTTWRFVGVATPRLASNFENGIDNNDLRLNLSAVLWKQKKDIEKPFRLILGLSYNSASGVPFPLPIVNYNKRFHPNWSYTIGIPRFEINYHSPKEKHLLQSALFVNGYFVNLQNDIILPSTNNGTAISSSALIGAFKYQYKFTKEISLYGLVGYSLFQNDLIRDGNRNRAYILNDQGNIYLRTGFKIGIL